MLLKWRVQARTGNCSACCESQRDIELSLYLGRLHKTAPTESVSS